MEICDKSGNERYILRYNNKAKKPLFIIGLNPSMADADNDDPTFRKMLAIAQNNSFDGVIVINLSPEITPNPEELHIDDTAIIEHGNQKTREEIERVIAAQDNAPPSVWCAWGAKVSQNKFRALKDNSRRIIDMFPDDTVFLRLPDLTKSGEPRHPLYSKSSSILVRFCPK